MKFEVTMAQAKVIVITVEGNNADDAVANAKKVTCGKHFDGRIGAIVAANVKELDDRNTS